MSTFPVPHRIEHFTMEIRGSGDILVTADIVSTFTQAQVEQWRALNSDDNDLTHVSCAGQLGIWGADKHGKDNLLQRIDFTVPMPTVITSSGSASSAVTVAHCYRPRELNDDLFGRDERYARAWVLLTVGEANPPGGPQPPPPTARVATKLVRPAPAR